jgi:hypothetical protein
MGNKKMNKTKLKLEDIKIESFITAIDEKIQQRYFGGTDDGTPCSDTCLNTCPPTCFSCTECVSGACGTCALTGGVHCHFC